MEIGNITSMQCDSSPSTYELRSQLSDIALIVRHLNGQLSQCEEDMHLRIIDNDSCNDIDEITFNLKLNNPPSNNGDYEYILEAVIHRRVALECHFLATRKGQLSIKRLVSNPNKDSLTSDKVNLCKSDHQEINNITDNDYTSNSKVNFTDFEPDYISDSLSFSHFKDEYELELRSNMDDKDISDSEKLNNLDMANELVNIDTLSDFINHSTNDIEVVRDNISEDSSNLSIGINQFSILARISALENAKNGFCKNKNIKNVNLDHIDFCGLKSIDQLIDDVKTDPNFQLYLEEKMKLNFAEVELENLKTPDLQLAQIGRDEKQEDDLEELKIAENKVVELKASHTLNVNNDYFKLNCTIEKLRKAEQKLNDIVANEIQLTNHLNLLENQSDKIDTNDTKAYVKDLSISEKKSSLKPQQNLHNGDNRLASIFQGKDENKSESMKMNEVSKFDVKEKEKQCNTIIQPIQSKLIRRNRFPKSVSFL